MITKKELNRIKELKKEIPFYGELSTSESKDRDSYKKLVLTLKEELELLEKKTVPKSKKWIEKIFSSLDGHFYLYSPDS